MLAFSSLIRKKTALLQGGLFCLLCTLTLINVHALSPLKQQDVHKLKAIQHQVVTLRFSGPLTSETAKVNPFTHYRLIAEFRKGKERIKVRGFYDADGHAGESSADSGNVWKVKFRPQSDGIWTYKVNFHKGEKIALSNDLNQGLASYFHGAKGTIMVSKATVDHDILRIKNGYFYFKNSGQYVLKVGTNSPENLLGYIDFDGTYRAGIEKNDIGKSSTKVLHKFSPHLKDWQVGDPSWKGGKGKSLVGAINYLASKKMNVIYFLTMNIKGDGKDVWPYIDDRTFDRFDVSKLAQWEMVFQHMEDKKMMMHIILQETENELLLDNGDTGDNRKIYLLELMARFAHHAGIIWNLGEENGPVSFSPNGQSAKQTLAMARFIKHNDPYQHPVFLHTHASGGHKDETLPGFMGDKALDGLSFQVNRPRHVADHFVKWQKAARDAGHSLAITMDEIGDAKSGAKPDADDASHDVMRQQVMWPTFMLGGGGVEWYFGYKYAHNDLNAEDWRSRDLMWDQTAYAKSFLTNARVFELPNDCGQELNSVYFCLTNKEASRAIVYLPQSFKKPLDIPSLSGRYTLTWLNPKTGEQYSSKEVVNIAKQKPFVLPVVPDAKQSDWALRLERH